MLEHFEVFRRIFDLVKIESSFVVIKPPSPTFIIFGDPVEPIMISE